MDAWSWGALQATHPWVFWILSPPGTAWQGQDGGSSTQPAPLTKSSMRSWPRGHPNVVDFPSAASPGREIARPCFSHQAPSHFPARSSGPCIESFPLPQGKTKASEAESGAACAERLSHGPATTGVAFWGCFQPKKWLPRRSRRRGGGFQAAPACPRPRCFAQAAHGLLVKDVT